MSVQIIPKQEYVKAAGLAAGLLHDDAKNYSEGQYCGKPLDESLQEIFFHMYTQNVQQYIARYQPGEIVTDGNSYDTEFQSMKAAGHGLVHDDTLFLKAIIELDFFCQSVIYNTFQDAAYDHARLVLNDLVRDLFVTYSNYHMGSDYEPQSFARIDLTAVYGIEPDKGDML